MASAGAPGKPKFLNLSVLQVCGDFMNRRAGILRALTTDVDEFFKQCDPDKENLCLYGNPDGTWKVCSPPENVPPPIPEPPIGINFARDEMERKDWLAVVAHHSDSWLLSVAIFYAGCSEFNKESRNKLFDCINGPPTLYEIMTGKAITETTCGACGSGTDGRSWILCNACQRGFHQKCTQQGKCPLCSKKRSKHKERSRA